MNPVVVDSSAWVEYLLRTEQGKQVGQVIEGPKTSLHIPHLCDVELASSLRRSLLTGIANSERVEKAVRAYLDLSVTRHRHEILIPRILELRDNFTAYGATYVALAERLDAKLLTCDGPLARAARRLVEIAE